MKKKILKIAMVAVVATVAGYGIYQNQAKDAMSELTLANVEALAFGESGDAVDCCNTCDGAYCGTFYPAGSMTGLKVYYKLPNPYL